MPDDDSLYLYVNIDIKYRLFEDICHAWQRRPPFPVNLRDLASL